MATQEKSTGKGNAKLNACMAVLVSLVVLFIGVYAICFTENSEVQKSGFAAIGLVIGYWLR